MAMKTAAVATAAVAVTMEAVATATSAVTETMAITVAATTAAAVTVAGAESMVVMATTMAVMVAATMVVIVLVAVTVTATTVCGGDNGSNSDGWGHRQQSTNNGGKDCLALQAGGSAHSAVLAPLVGGGICPTFPVGSRGGGGHDGRVMGAGCEGCVWGCAYWLCVCCKPLLFC